MIGQMAITIVNSFAWIFGDPYFFPERKQKSNVGSLKNSNISILGYQIQPSCGCKVRETIKEPHQLTKFT